MVSAQTIIVYRLYARGITGMARVRFYAPETLPDGRRMPRVFSEITVLSDDLPELLKEFRQADGYLVESDSDSIEAHSLMQSGYYL